MLTFRYFIYNSKKLNFLIIGMVISMIAFSMTSLVIDGLTNEIDSITQIAQNEITEIKVISEDSMFSKEQLGALESIMEKHDINVAGLSSTQLSEKYNRTKIISNLEFYFSFETTSNVSRLEFSKEIAIKFVNVTQLFPSSSRLGNQSNMIFVDRLSFQNNPNLFILGHRYQLTIDGISTNTFANLTLAATFDESFGYGLIADSSLLNSSTIKSTFNRLTVTTIPQAKLAGLLVNNNIDEVLRDLNNIQGVVIRTDSLVSDYLRVSKRDIISLLQALLLSIFSLILVSIANSSYLLIQESMHEIRVLKALGFSRLAIVKLFMGQFVLVALLSSIIAFVTSIVVFNLIFSILAIAFDNLFVTAEAPISLLWMLVGISSFTSVIGSIIGFAIKKMEDPEAL